MGEIRFSFLGLGCVCFNTGVDVCVCFNSVVDVCVCVCVSTLVWMCLRFNYVLDVRSNNVLDLCISTVSKTHIS